MSTTIESPAAHLPEAFTVDSAELRARVSAHTPIRFTASNEPYIPLPAPHEAYKLCVMRQSDAPVDQAMMSDIRVARTIVGPAFPCPLVNVQKWLVVQRGYAEKLFAQYAEGTFLPACTDPFAILRDGEDQYVGQVTLCGWELGAALRPEFHGKGLASAAVAVKMHEWAVGQMGATELRAQCFVSNVASVKLWQKHGFVEDPALRGEITVSEAKGGGVEPDMTLIWRK